MRAILLAAGMGTRLRPLTLTTPKSLVPVNGKPMLERQIEFLQEKGVTEIYVVTGYLHEKFDYLKGKYNGVQLVHNNKYDVFNNIYTMYLVREYLPDSYVIDADNYLHRNFLIECPGKSMYFSAKKKDFKNEWMLRFDRDNKIYDIEVGDGSDDYILCGVSYWSQEDGELIARKVEEDIQGGNFSDRYWDDIVKDHLGSLNVFIHKIKEDDSFEIDSLEDLEKANAYLEYTSKERI
jgi:L-glutamine-phosphate cytidylyltransferase